MIYQFAIPMFQKLPRVLLDAVTHDRAALNAAACGVVVCTNFTEFLLIIGYCRRLETDDVVSIQWINKTQTNVTRLER